MNDKKGLLRLLACILAVVMTVAVFAMPVSAIPEYQTGANDASEAYKSGKYYQNLMNIPLSGDGVSDVLAVALSQLGYAEGNSLDAISGTQPGSKNYTEYYYNFGMAVDTWSEEWCAAFCSWALYQSGVSRLGNLNDWCRDHKGDENYIWREISCSHWAEQLELVGRYEKRGTYIPNSGDLIFFVNSGNIKHMGIVVWCDGSTVYTVEGNTSSGNGIDGNGGGVYYKSYALSNVGIDGYGILPYESGETPKVDYSGKNKTAGFYMTKSEFWVAASSGGELDFKIPQYEMFKVTGFDGQYAVIEYGEGRYYSSLNSNTLQITVDNSHVHNYEATWDETHHMNKCDCGESINVAEHEFNLKFNNTFHYLECDCGYIDNDSRKEHILVWGESGEGHVQTCSCGYKSEMEVEEHSFTILEHNENEHFYRCKCGAVNAETVEAHDMEIVFDDTNHYNECKICHRIDDSTKEEHSFDMSTNYDKCKCGYDRSAVDAEHSWVIAYDGQTHYQECLDCKEVRKGTLGEHSFDGYQIDGSSHALTCDCGYVDEGAREAHVYDRYGCVAGNDLIHAKMCKCGAILKGSEEAHYYDNLVSGEQGHWLECDCGLKKDVEAHTKKNGTCTECGYHTHTYHHDDEGHWMTCDCDGSKTFEKHVFEDGACTICGYSAEKVCAHTVKDGACTICGYHEHTYAYTEDGHWLSCGCVLADKKLVEHSMEADVCTECGYNTKNNSMHRFVNGTCADCGYHQHVYIYDANGHKNVCDCYLNGELERHSLTNGKCSVCDYDASKATDNSDKDKGQPLVKEESENGAASKGCGSVIGTSATIFGVAMMLGCVVALKKKEDN